MKKDFWTLSLIFNTLRCELNICIAISIGSFKVFVGFIIKELFVTSKSFTLLEKNAFSLWATAWSSEIISSPSTSVIFEDRLPFSDKKWFDSFPKHFVVRYTQTLKFS